MTSRPTSAGAFARGRAAALGLLLAGLASHAATGGPDNAGYRWSDNVTPTDGYSPTYAWTPITGTTLTLSDDQLSAPIAIPFTFTFYGVARTQLWVSSNGYISFTGDTQGCCTGYNPPNSASPNGWIAWAWNDFWPPGTGATVTYATGGTAPNRYFVVEFNAVPHCCSNGSYPISTQTWLYEGSNQVVMQLNTVTSDGSNTTIGLENDTGTVGLLYANSAAAGTFVSGRAVRFYQPPPTQLSFATTAQTTAVGACSAVATIRPYDATGNLTSVAAATSIALSSTAPALTFYSDSNCTAAVSQVTMPAGGNTASFYFRGSAAGSPTITGAATGLTPATQTQTVLGTRLAFTTAPQTLLYSTCSGITTVQNQTGGGTPQNVSVLTAVALSSSSGTMAFYSNPTCTTPITSVNLPVGGSSASFYFRDSTVGYPTITATASGIVPGTQVESIESPPASEYPWQTNENGTLSVNIGWDYNMGYGFTPQIGGFITRLCGYFSGTKQVRLYNRSSGAVLASATVTSANAWSCVSIPTVTVTAGVPYSVAVYLGGSGGAYRSSTAAMPATYGSIRIDGSCYAYQLTSEPCAYSGFITTTMYGMVDIGFSPDPPTLLAFASSAQALATGACSAPLTVESRNTQGPSPVAVATPVTLTSTSATMTFFAAADTTCATPLAQVTLAAGSSQVQFRFRDSSVGTPNITASATGLTSAVQAQTLYGSRLVFTSAPQAPVVGLCSGAVVVQNQTGGGAAQNVGAPTLVSLSSTSSANTFYSDPGCATPVTTRTISTGTSSTTVYFRDLNAGSPSLTATASAIAPGTQAQSVLPCTPYETPLATNATGTVSTGLVLSSTSGYSFTPAVAGGVYALCGFFTGTKTMYLIDRSTQAVVGTAQVTSADAWACANLTVPVRVDAGRQYTVAVNNAGAGSAQRDLGTPVARRLPKTWGNLTIEWGCSGPAGSSDPCNSSVNDRYIDGVVDVRFAPDQATGLAISSAPQTIPASACSAPATVDTRGCNGSNQRVSAVTGVGLTSTSGTMSFFAASDSACATPITSVTVPANAGSAQFRFRDTAIGAPTVTAAATGLTSGTQVENIVAAGPTRLRFSTAAQSVAAGGCSGVTTVQAQDGTGNPSNVTSATTINLSTSQPATGRFYTDSGCTSQVASVVMGAGTSSVNLYFRDTVAGTPTLTAAATGLSSGTQVETITPASATRLVFASAAQTVVAGSCSAAATFRTEDTYGNLSPVGAPTPVGTSSSSATGTFFSDPGCTAQVTGVNLVAGANSGNFYFKDTRSGGPTLTVSATGFTSGTQVETISAAAPAQLAFASGALTLTAGGCGGPVTVQARDIYGNPASVGAATVVTLSSTSPTGTFYTAAGCGTATGTITIAAGTNSAVAYYGDTTAGLPTTTASAAGLSSGTQVQTVNAGSASRLAVDTPAQTLSAGQCSAATVAQSRDGFGNPAAVGGATVVTLGSSSPGNGFYSDPGCTAAIGTVTIAAGASTASFYFRDTRAGTPTLTLSATGFTSGTQVETIDAAAVAKLAFTTGAQSLPAGGCSGVVTVQSRDAWDNVSAVSAATGVGLSSTSPGATFYSDAACSAVVAGVTIAAGGSSANFYFKDTRAGSPTVTAASPGLTSAAQVHTISAGAAIRLAFTSAPKSQAAGACSTAVTITSEDGYANAANLGAATTVNLSSTSAGNTFYSDTGCSAVVTTRTINGGQSSTTVYFRDTVAGSPTLTAAATGLTSGTQVQAIAAGAPNRLVFVTGAQTLTAGSCSAVATVQSRDLYDNPANVAGSTVVSLSSTSGGGTFYSDASCTAAVGSTNIPLGGSTASFYFRDTVAGSPTITAAAAGLTGATQVETINPAASNRLSFITTAQTLAAGACSAITTVQSQTSGGAPLNVGAPVSVGLASSSGSNTFYSDPGCTSAVTVATIATGTSTASFYFKDTLAGSPTLTATATGYTAGNQAETLNPATASRLVFLTAAQSLVAGACSAASTVQTRDAYNNVSSVAAATAISLSSSSTGDTFYSDPTCTTVVTAVTLGAGGNSVNFYFRDTVAGSPTVTAAATGFTSATQVQTITAGTASRLAFTTAAKNQPAGACSTAITLQTRDANDNPSNVTAATAVNLTRTSAGGAFYSDPTCATAIASVTVSAGTSSASFYYRDTRSGTSTITAAATGFTNATQVETITALSPVSLVFITASRTVIAGACSASVQVQTRDTYNNAAPVSAATTVSYVAAPADVTFYAESTCLTPVTTRSIGAGGTTATVYFKSNVSGSKTVTVSSTGLTGASQTETVNPATASRLVISTPAQTVTAGTCSAITTVRSQDTYGNYANVATATAVALANSSGAGTFYSDAACTLAVAGVTINAGTSTANFYWKDTRAGSSTLTASATGLTSGTQAQTVNAAAPNKLAFTSAPQTLPAGGCSAAITIQSQDVYSNPANVAAAATITLGTTSGGGGFFTNPTCATGTGTAQIAAGGNTATVYYRDTADGTPTLSASATGLAGATQVQTISAASASRLAFVSAAQTLTAGACSGLATIQSQDTFGNTSPVGAALAVNLSSSAGGTTFFSDATCTTPLTQVTIAAASSDASFYFSITSAGAATLTAAASGFTSGNQAQTINPAAPVRLVYLTAAQTVVAGTCSPSGLTLQSQDTYGNPAPVATATSVSLTSSAGSTVFSAVAGCGSSTSSVTLGAGASTVGFYFRDNVSGAPTLTGAAVGLTPASQAQTVNAAAPNALAYTTAPQTVPAGSCSAVLTVRVRDTFGNTATVGAATSVTLSSTSGTTAFFSDAACTLGTGSTTIPAGGSTANFYFRDAAAGAPTLTAAATGLTFASQNQTVTAGAPAALAFTSSPQTLLAGACSAQAVVQSRDASGNPAVVSTPTSVSLSSSSPGGTFYSDSGCASAIASVTIAAGANSAGFYFRDTRAGSPTLTAVASGLTPAAQAQTINAGAATRLGFASVPQVVVAGGCSGALTVQSQDGFGNGSAVAAATTVTLSSSSTGDTFYSDASCTTVAATAVINAGASAAVRYFRDTVAGTPTVTATATGFTPGTQVQTVNPAAPTLLAFLTPAQTLSAGACSSIATIQTRDTYQNPSSVAAALPVSLTSSSAGGSFYSDPACTASVTGVTVPGGASTASFYFKDNSAGSPTLTASAGGYSSATQVQTVNPAAASRLVFTTAAQTLTAGACSAVATLQSRDTAGNPSNVATNTTVTLSSSSPQGTFYSDATCATPVTTRTIIAGTSSVSFWFRDTRAGTPTVTASATGFTSGNQTELINNATANRLVFTSAAQTLVAGGCSAVATLQSQDTYGNPANVAASTAVGLSSSSAAGTFYSDPACSSAIAGLTIAAGARTGTFYFRDTLAGGPTLTGAATGFASATQAQTINPAAPSRLAFVSAAQTLPAGGCSAVVTLRVQDQYGNTSPVAGATAVSLSSTSGQNTFYSGAGCSGAIAGLTLAAGSSSANLYFRDTRAGSPTLTAAAAGLSSATQAQTINPATATVLAFLSAPQTLTAGACSALTQVQSRDAYGNASNVSGATVVGFSTNSAGGSFYSDPACATPATGATIAAGASLGGLYFRDTRAGSPTLTAAATGFSSATQTQAINPAAPSRLAFTNTPLTLTAGSCSSALTVTAQDTYGNPSPVAGATVVTLGTNSGQGTFFQNGSCGTAVGTVTIGAGAVSANAFYGDTRAGTPTLTATATGFSAAAQAATVNAAAASRLVFATSPQTLAAGVCSAVATVQAQDAYGNPANVTSATTVVLTTTSAGGTFSPASGCGTTLGSVTLAAGSSSVGFRFRDTRAGAPTLTATAAGLGSTAQVQTINPAAVAQLAFATAAQTVVAGACSAVATAQTQDAFGNPSPVGAATSVGLGTTSGGGTFYSNSTCTSAVSAVTVLAGSSAAGFYWKDTSAGTPTLTLSSGSWTSATQVQTVNPAPAAQLAFSSAPQTVVAGACSGATTVQSRDGFGNPSAVVVATSVSLSTTSGGGTFYADPACGTPIASGTIPAGASVTTFYFRDTRAGAPVLSASAGGLSPGTQQQTVGPAAASRLAFISAPLTLTAGGCSAQLQVQSQDAYGNAAALGAGASVGLGTTSSGGAFFSDAACGTGVAAASIAPGGNTAAFYYRDTRSGSPTVTATAASLAAASQVETVNPAAPAVLAFTSAPQVLTAGACSAAAALQTRDSFGNVSAVPAATSLSLSTTSSGGAFFSDPACASPAASATVPAGASAATFYFRDTRAGGPTLTAVGTGFTSATQVQTITPAAPSRLAFITTAQTLVAGACSALAQVQTQDGFGNPSNVAAPTAVGLSTSSAAGAFYSDAGCSTLVGAITIAGGANTGGFYWKDTAAGAPSLTASGSGLTSASQVQAINPAAPSRLAYVTLAQSVTAGACSGAAQLQSQDSFGNPSAVAAATSVGLVSSSPTMVFYSDAGCSAVVTAATLAAGSSLGAFYFRDNTAGTPTITASGPGLGSAAQVETINPAPAARLVIVTTARTVTAGACSLVITVQSQDNLGNPSAVTVPTPVSLASNSSGGGFFSDAACGTGAAGVTIGAGSNSASFYYRDTVAGSPTVSGTSAGFASASQVESVVPAPPARLVLLTAPQTLTAGACSAALTLQVQDAFNNPSNVGAATTVTLVTGSAGGAFFADGACGTALPSATVAAGANTTTLYYRDTRAGSALLTFSSGSLTPATQTEVVQPASPSQLAFTTTAQAVTAGACSAVATVQTRDAFGNASAVAAATSVALSSSAGTGTFYSDPGCATAIASATVAAGASSGSFYWKDTRAGTPTLTAAAAGLGSVAQGQTVNPAAPSRLVLTTAAQTLVAGTCSAGVGVQAQDQYGNASAVPADTAVGLSTTSSGGTFSAAAGCGGATSSVTMSAGSSSATFYFRDTLVGTPTLTATAASLTPATQGATITPAPADRLVFTTAAQTLVAGTCSAAATVQTRDAFDNVSAVTAATTVTLSSSSAGATFFSDPGCTTAIPSVSFAAGSSSRSFYFRDTRAGSPTLTAGGGGLTAATQVQTINPAALARLGFTTSAQTLTAGSCSAIATVQSQDTYGNARAVAAATVVGLTSSAGTSTFYSDSGCSLAVTQVTIAAAANSANFYFRDTGAGAHTLTAASSGLVSATQAATINPAAPDRLVFVTAAQTLIAGACSAIATVESRDLYGNPSPVGAATLVNLSTSGGSTTFSAIAGCGSTTTQVSLGAGATRTNFYFRDTLVGTRTLTASASGLSAATQPATIDPAPAAVLAFTTAAQTRIAGACSAAIGVQTRDGFGNPSNVTLATTVNLGTNSAGGGFFSDSTCLSAISNVVMAAGANTRTFYYRDTRAGSPTLTVTATGLTQATQVETINPAAATVIVFTSTPATVTAGACAPIRNLQTRDIYGNTSAVSGSTAVALATTSGGGSFHSNNACSSPITGVNINAGASGANFYFKDTVAGTPTLTASATGFASGTQVQTINPATAVALAFTSTAQTVVAGECSALATVRSRDTYGNPSNVAAANAVTLSSSGGGVFYSDPGCTSATGSVPLAAGTNTVTFYFRHTLAGSPTLTASASGLGATTQGATIVPAAAARLSWVTPAQTLTAGGCSAVLIAQTQDQFGNARNMPSSILVTLSSSSLAGSFYADPSCNSPVAAVTVVVGSSSANLYYQDTRAGTATVTAASSGLASANQVETINPAAPSRLAFTSAPQTLNAGQCSAAATVQTQDAFGNASPVVSASTIALASSSPTGTFSAVSGCGSTTTGLNLGAGQSTTSFYFKDTAAGGPTLTATISGLSSATQVETINPAPPTRLAFATAPQTLNAGACSALMTVEARDGSGNASAVGAPTTIGLGTSAGTGAFYSDAACTQGITDRLMAAGSSTVGFYFKDTAVGSRTLTASASGFSPATQTATITTAGSATRLAFVTAPQTVVAGACSAAATVQTQDSFGNVVNVGATTVALSSSAATGQFFSNPGCTVPATSVPIAAGGNSATFYFKDTRAGTPTLTTAAAGLSNGTQVETVNPGAATALAFASPAQSLDAGACSAAIIVRVQDLYANATTVAVVTSIGLLTSSGGGTFYSDAACGTLATGAAIGAGGGATTFYYRDTRAGMATLTAQGAGLASATQVETIGAGPATRLAFTTSAQTITAGGCSAVATVQVQDALGNPAPVSATTSVALASSSTSLVFYSDPLCSSAVAARTVASGSSAANFYFKDDVVGSPSLTASTAGLADATQNATIIPGAASTLAVVSPPLAVVAGACSAVMTVETRDDLGNTSAVTSQTSVVPTSTASTGAFYSDDACTLPVVARVIAAGGSSVTFYYRDTRTGTPTVTMSNPGLVSASQAEAVVPAPPVKLAFATPAQSLQVGTCSAAATIEVRDVFDNPSPVAVDTVAAAGSSSPTFTFFSDPGCASAVTQLTVPAAGTQATFYFRDSRSGTATATLTATALTPASQVETLGAGAPVAIAFATPARTAIAGACSPVLTVEARDSLDNATTVPAALAVALSSSAATTRFFSDPACATAATGVTIAAGAVAASFYARDAAAGAPTLTAQTQTLGNATQQHTVVPAAASKLAFATPPRTAVVARCSPLVTVESRDAFDNPAAVTAAETVTLSATSGSVAFFSDAACTAPLGAVALAVGTGALSLYFSDSAVGQPILLATGTSLAPGSQAATVIAGPPVGLAFVTAPQTVPVGVCSAIATVEARDSFGNPAPVAAAVTVSLSASSQTLGLFADPACAVPMTAFDIAGGASQGSFYFRDSAVGTATLTASSVGLAGTTQDESFIVASPPAKLAFVSAPVTVEAGACSGAIVLNTQDASGAAAPLASAITVALSTSSTVAGLYADPTCTTRITSVAIAAADYRAVVYLRDAVVEPVVVSAAAPPLAGASQAQTVVCPASVDGAFCDDADRCNGRETCRGGACTGGTALACDDGDACTVDSCAAAVGCQNVVTGSCCVKPAVARDANPTAAVGVPYRFNAAGGLTLLRGTGPVSFSPCTSGPAGLFVDASTGAVDWAPSTAGPATICLQAVGACGVDAYTFTVSVAATPGPRPVARLSIPATFAAGAAIAADGSASAPSPALAYLWNFGDGSPLASGATVSHAWARPGGYRVRLTVFDAFGQSDTADALVQARGGACAAPPTVAIDADALRGQGSLAVAFQARYQGADPAPVARWDLGDGTTAAGLSASHTFGPGKYRVALEVVTREGCTASDAVTVEVDADGNRAPHCSVVATPVAGVAPLSATFTASYGDSDGTVSSATWLFSDGVTADAQRFNGIAARVLDRPGALVATLEVLDDRGAPCRASVRVEAGNTQELYPPQIVSVPTLTARCEVPYVYGEDGTARALGSRPLSWSLGKGSTGAPQGMSIDEAGVVSWTPAKGKRTERVTLVAQNAAGAVEQDFVVQVECAQGGGACGCSSGGGVTALGLLALGLLARRRKKK